MFESLFHLIHRHAPGKQFQVLRRVDVGVVWVRQVAERTGADLLCRIPGDPAQRVIHALKPAGHVHQGHADGCVHKCVFKGAGHGSSLTFSVTRGRARRCPKVNGVSL
jgi:hypothetical protein